MRKNRLIKSATALRMDIDNTPNREQQHNLTLLEENLIIPLETYLNQEINISSGFRCEELNTVLGGSTTSYHLRGMAVDIDQDGHQGATNSDIFYAIKNNLPYTELIWEFGGYVKPAWVHVAYDESDLVVRETLIAYKQDGRTRYTEWSEGNLARIYNQ